MKKNIGNADKGIRILVAVILSSLVFFEVVTGTMSYVFLGVSIIFLLTSFLNFCPLYLPFGLSTIKKEEKA